MHYLPRSYFAQDCWAAVGKARNRTARPTEAAQVFSVKGTVKEIKLADKQITIEHEKIPNYMDAMTMDFDVKSTNELQGVQVGDYVFRSHDRDAQKRVDRPRSPVSPQPRRQSPMRRTIFDAFGKLTRSKWAIQCRNIISPMKWARRSA